jgi:hypothetical protein
MDSVEQTIRMNNLSKELRKYGFAQSSQEAIAQAGQIYGMDTDSINDEHHAKAMAVQGERNSEDQCHR